MKTRYYEQGKHNIEITTHKSKLKRGRVSFPGWTQGRFAADSFVSKQATYVTNKDISAKWLT